MGVGANWEKRDVNRKGSTCGNSYRCSRLQCVAIFEALRRRRRCNTEAHPRGKRGISQVIATWVLDKANNKLFICARNNNNGDTGCNEVEISTTNGMPKVK